MCLGKNHKRRLLLIARHKGRSQLTGIITFRYELVLPRLLCALQWGTLIPKIKDILVSSVIFMVKIKVKIRGTQNVATNKADQKTFQIKKVEWSSI